MLQRIDGRDVFVTEFFELPTLPVMGLTAEEETYERMLSMARGYTHPSYDPQYPKQGLYAKILTLAIQSGMIDKPGKYGLEGSIQPNGALVYNVFEIEEPPEE